MAGGDEALRLLDEIREKRGYVLPFHRTLAARDPAYLRAYEGLLGAGYTDERLLSAREKEIALVAALTAVGSERSHIKTHMEVAVRLGVTADELLQTLELCLMPSGVPRFMNALAAWRELFEPPAASATEA